MIEERLAEALRRVERIRVAAIESIGAADSSNDLEAVRVRYTGKRSELNQVMQEMARLAPADRKVLGATVNGAKQEIDSALAGRAAEIQRRELRLQLENERLDVTLPGTQPAHGFRHPVLMTVREILDILSQMGFSIYEGPEVEWDRYNFEMLNIPKFHPARDAHDTFYVTDEIVLRTHTSPAQARYMETHQPPIRIAVPGIVYRNEEETPKNADMFFQIEALVVDTDVTFADLKGTLTEVARRVFGADRKVRFRPGYFPFTEPSAEMDIDCIVCDGAGCRSCSYEGWVELLGSGMVHPNVLRAVGYDPDVYSGFAWGMGPDRFTMMKYGIPDVRLFRENDLRFLSQFS